jgi:hypothetical protein
MKKNLHSRPLPEEVRRLMTRIVKHAEKNPVGKLGKEGYPYDPRSVNGDGHR